MMLRRTSGSPPVMPQLAHAAWRRRRCTAGPAPRASAVAPWAGTSCARPCSRRSGNRSGRSPRRADSDRPAEGSISGVSVVWAAPSIVSEGHASTSLSAEGMPVRVRLSYIESFTGRGKYEKLIRSGFVTASVIWLLVLAFLNGELFRTFSSFSGHSGPLARTPIERAACVLTISAAMPSMSLRSNTGLPCGSTSKSAAMPRTSGSLSAPAAFRMRLPHAALRSSECSPTCSLRRV